MAIDQRSLLHLPRCDRCRPPYLVGPEGLPNNCQLGSAIVGSIPPVLDQYWVLDDHYRGGDQTWLGSLVDRARCPNEPPDRVAGDQLARCLAFWMSRCASRISPSFRPVWRAFSVVVPVPTLPTAAADHLPTMLASAVASTAGLRFEAGLVEKTRPTPKIENVPEEERETVLGGAFRVPSGQVSGAVLVVDDRLQSGATMTEVARTLRDAGASRVAGLAVTRLHRETGADDPETDGVVGPAGDGGQSP